MGGGALSALWDLLLPVRCVGCDEAAGPLCPPCLRECRSPAGAPAIGVAPVAPGVPAAAAGEYAGPLRAALLAYKERGHRALAAPLGALLADAVAGALFQAGPVVGVGTLGLVPVPSTSAAVRARGDDHALRLARSAARTLRARLRRAGAHEAAGPVRTVRAVAALTVVRPPVADSVGLTAAERRANVVEAFGPGRRARQVPPTEPIVLVDDIVTTGATLTEAVRAARSAGLRVVGTAVVAATRLSRPPRR